MLINVPYMEHMEFGTFSECAELQHQLLNVFRPTFLVKEMYLYV